MSQQQTFMPNDRERLGKKKRSVKKSVIVQYRAKEGRSSLWFRDWTTFKRYETRAQAEQTLKQKSSDKYFQYRILE